jgi:hypothetical protein
MLDWVFLLSESTLSLNDPDKASTTVSQTLLFCDQVCIWLFVEIVVRDANRELRRVCRVDLEITVDWDKYSIFWADTVLRERWCR